MQIIHIERQILAQPAPTFAQEIAHEAEVIGQMLTDL